MHQRMKKWILFFILSCFLLSLSVNLFADSPLTVQEYLEKNDLQLSPLFQLYLKPLDEQGLDENEKQFLDLFVQLSRDKQGEYGKIIFKEKQVTASLLEKMKQDKNTPTDLEEGIAYTLRDIGPAGGYIFYDKGYYSNGWQYLEAAPATSEWIKPWGSFENDFVGVTETSIGSGQNNTITIVTWMNSHSEIGKAAQLCDSLNYGGYNDWFLPSKDELNKIYLNLKVYGIGGFVDSYYWSSSTGPLTNAWGQNFKDGSQGYYGEGGNRLYVRAVRAF